jgi:hypothetical protein
MKRIAMTDPLENLQDERDGKHAPPPKTLPKKRGRPKKPRQPVSLAGLDTVLSFSTPPTMREPSSSPLAMHIDPPTPRLKKRKKSRFSTTTNVSLQSKGEEKPVEYWQLRAYALSEPLHEFLVKEGIHLDVSSIRRMSGTHMNNLLEDIDEALDRQLASNVCDDSLQMGMNVVEELIQKNTRIKPRGATAAMWSDPKWRALYERFKIGHDIGIRPLNPTLELLMTTSKIIQNKHAENSGVLQQPVIDLTKASGSDL